MSYDDLLLEAEMRMEKSVEYLQQEYKKLRTGRASTGLVENVKIDYYGSPTPLKQLATIGVPEAQLIVIRPFDPGSVEAIEKGLLASDVGITPNSDGTLIRLSVPPLSEERRKQIVNQTREMAEEARIAVRNERRDAIKAARKEEDAGEMTEDDLEDFKNDVQELTDQYTDQIDELQQSKSEELMEV
ncbi:MAG: ribosome recycling factor [Planctomycetota bacterium]